MLTLKTIGDVSDEEMVIDIDKDSEGDVYLKQDNLSMTEIKWMGSQTDFISYGDDKESACNCAESGFNRRGDGGL